MGIGLGDEHAALAAAVAELARDLGAAALVKASETDGPAVFAPVASGLTSLGLAGIALPESVGGGGGTLLDAAVAVEAAAAAIVPGVLLPTVVAGLVLPSPFVDGIADGSVTIGLGLRPGGPVLGAGIATHLLLPDSSGGLGLHESTGVEVTAGPLHDLSTRVGSCAAPSSPLAVVPGKGVGAVALTLAAAEASGIARWCLDTAVAYAQVREQFGRPIGSFQALKHLCASMLERAEAATALAWDAARAFEDGPEQHEIAAAAAGAAALDHAVTVAQDCIQVLGGIGFTWEHDAHLYLRRAIANRLWLGGSDRWRLRLAELAAAGVRRAAHVDLGDEAEAVRASVRGAVAEVAAAPGERRREVLADTGLLMPHWPAPYGRDAGPVEQLVIDEELDAAGIAKPSLAIGAWAAPTIVQAGSDEQRKRFLRPTLTGEITWCQLFSEPGAGSDLASLRTRAERTEGGWLLSGQKVWTSVAKESDWAICLARTNPDAPQHKGITYFLVDMTSDGIDIRPLRELTGEALFNEVFLDGVFVPDDCVVGEVDGGWPLARTTLANERVAIGGRSFGVSVERALALLSPDTGPVEQLRVGAAVAASSTVKALSLRGALRSLAGHGPGPESSVVKLLGVQERQDSSELVLDLLGDRALLADETGEGDAAMHEALLTRCLSIAGGTTQVLRNLTAERILRLPRG
ncbi:acyl-CoA dehydrogenase family protein [Nocardioides marmoribigeumensis]|uniref:Alkylation response protein AidB-like acyl-CoA dehydrogenase n=1 Tax=Nocardioides marmoribigeumensis TaxID=433649 RepID=A0ABU2C1W0_9ACTN|nr:acyl-CoA dehydrogenase family protein [Nocardioides marmoribigeumensis]MDR7364621.1 alkylation response protein AidB-like acyl-CoA dehydrogenase [Nocardioides marmoribigeumensis]